MMKFLKSISIFAGAIGMLAILPAHGETNENEPSAKELSAKIEVMCVADTKDECIVRNFSTTAEASLIRGKIAYSHYCVLCHGKTGIGDGRAAKIHNPKPANLTISTVSPEYMDMIIRKGGEAMGRSMAMPPWGEQLTDEQVKDIINYLMSIRKISQ